MAEYKFNVKDQYLGAADGTAYYREPLQSGNGVSDTPFMNFWPELVTLKRVDDGFTARDFITFRAYRIGKYEPQVDLEKKEIIGNQPHARFSPACRIYRERGSIARCTELMLMQCENASTKQVYSHTGWRVINGKRVFLNGGYSVCAEGLTDQYTVQLDPDLEECYRFIPCKNENYYAAVLDLMPKVAPDWLVIPSLAYVFLTPLNEMLRHKGAEPCFSFYLIARTGSYKSSWAKVLLGFFGNLGYAEKAPIRFLDSINSIGRKLAVGADIPLLLDDRRDDSSTADKMKYEGIERYVSSAIGDRAARGRLNADSTAKVSYTPKCNLIITAEQGLHNIGSSAIARSVAVEMTPDTVDFDHLTELQDRTGDLNRVMQDFIQWVILNYETLSEGLKPQLKKYREIFTGAGHARLATAFSQMTLGYCTFLKFMKDKGQLADDTAESMAQRAITIFLEMCEAQGRKVESEKSTNLFAELLRQMLEAKQVKLCDLRKQEIFNGDTINPPIVDEKTIGYRDERYLYLIPLRAYNEVSRFCAQGGTCFPASAAALWKAYRDEGKLVPDAGGKRMDKRKAINGKQARYIWLTADILEEGEDENNGQ